MTDMELIDLIKKSPHKGHSTLITEYSRYVYAIVYNKLRRCGSEEDIEECVSDIFADVFIAIDNGETDNLKALIGTISKRTAIDYFRKLSIKNNRTVSAYENEEVQEFASDFDVEKVSDSNEIRRLLLNFIESLGEPDSTILMQKFYYERSSVEIADAVSMNASSVRSRCMRAMNKLRTMLIEAGITR